MQGATVFDIQSIRVDEDWRLRRELQNSQSYGVGVDIISALVVTWTLHAFED